MSVCIKNKFSSLIRIALVDADSDYRVGIQDFLATQKEIRVEYSKKSVDELLCAVHIGRVPQVVIIDIEPMPRITLSSISVLKQQLPELEILVLSQCFDTDIIIAAMTAGATGYLLKDTPRPHVKSAILEMVAGGAPMSPAIARKILGQFKEGVIHTVNSCNQLKTCPMSNLTPREQDVVKGLVDGLAYKEIAHRLNIGLETVRQHIKNIYGKLNVHSKAQVIAKVLHADRVA